MALFDKLFSLKRRLDSDYRELRPGVIVRSCQINPEQVRLLLFKECDWRGRRLLFDSSAIQKVPSGKHDRPNGRQDDMPCVVEISDGYSYVYKGPEADATVLGEMIFGAVAMNYKSVSLKIHIMDEPRRLMCTKVFCVPSSRRISRGERKTSSQPDTSNIRNASKPLNVPSMGEDGVALSFSMDRGDSGFCGDHSSYSSVGSTNDYFSMFDSWDGSTSQEDLYWFHSLPGRKLSTSSNGSWQRRTFQNIATRFQLGHQSSHLLNTPTANTSSDSQQIYSNSSTSGTSDSIASASSIPQRKNKLGLAVLITASDSVQLDLVRKCVEHSPQLQALVCRLRLATLAAGAGGGFVSTLHRAAEDAARWLSDLIYGPRLPPVWLNMVTSEARISNKIADTLLSDLCSILAAGDTKTTNFFISTLLTHVLTYHLGWVTTVSPYDTIDHQKVPTPSEAKLPYNALWAQLGDLCGSIGFPPRAARTIISGGKNSQFVNRLLIVLTYFLRCGDVKRTEFRYHDCVPKKIKTISVNQCVELKRTVTRNKLGSDDSLTVPSNTQNSDSSDSTLVASDVSLKKTSALANLSQKLSTSSECCSSGQKLMTSPLRRNPTMMHTLKASSDSSLNSSVSEDSEAEQRVVFVLGDDEKLVGLKNKSNNGKCVKKSSKIHNEPVNLEPEKKEECAKEGCVTRNTESPSKCCGQTLQHSKAIKHSGFKFEFDKYPQIVTNYMKSKNLEILDRHYIGKPGNLKLDNYQFDPMIVPPIQEEERCEICDKCQMMESMLQTPTNASEMEFMNDLPRQMEPQFAKEITTHDNKRELSPKTFVRKRKENTVVVNLIRNIRTAAEGKESRNSVTRSEQNLAELKKEDSRTLLEKGPSVSPKDTYPTIYVQDATLDLNENIQIPSPKLRTSLSRLRFTKSTNNLQSLLSMEVSTKELRPTDNELQSPLSSNESKSNLMEALITKNTKEWKLASNNLHSLLSVEDTTNELKPTDNDLQTSISINETKTEPTALNNNNLKEWKLASNNLHSLLSMEDSTNDLRPTYDQQTPVSSNEPKSNLVEPIALTITNSKNVTSTVLTTSNSNELKLKSSCEELKMTISSTEPKSVTSSDKQNSSSLNDLKSVQNERNSSVTSKPTLLEVKLPTSRRVKQRERDKSVGVKTVIEFPLGGLSESETVKRSGFDASLLGGVTDHYVPDLVLQGTIAKPSSWEPELRRDLDIASYLNKQLDAPIQAVAIIGDTNAWEVRVVGRDCGSGGMSSLVGAMLDAIPAMWRAKVPAHQCLFFLEGKLREFCVLSKTLADMLMSTDFCDIATLTKALNIDVNDVPLLLAVATTHTPQVATRYGISYR